MCGDDEKGNNHGNYACVASNIIRNDNDNNDDITGNLFTIISDDLIFFNVNSFYSDSLYPFPPSLPSPPSFSLLPSPSLPPSLSLPPPPFPSS